MGKETRNIIQNGVEVVEAKKLPVEAYQTKYGTMIIQDKAKIIKEIVKDSNDKI